jgi:hypothetical protein
VKRGAVVASAERCSTVRRGGPAAGHLMARSCRAMYPQPRGGAQQDVHPVASTTAEATRPPALSDGTGPAPRRWPAARCESASPPRARARRPQSRRRFSAPVVHEIPRAAPPVDDTVW